MSRKGKHNSRKLLSKMEGFFSSMAAHAAAANAAQNNYNNNSSSNGSSSSQRSHTNNDHSKQFKCDFCDKSFTQRRNQRAHIRTVHEKLKPFQCTHCGLTANRKFNLLSHIKKMHGSVEGTSVIDTRLSGASAAAVTNNAPVSAKKSKAAVAENVQQLCLVCSAPVKTANKYFCDKCDQRFTAPAASSGMSSYLSNVQGRNFQQQQQQQQSNLPRHFHTNHSNGHNNGQPQPQQPQQQQAFRCLQCPFFTDDSSAMIGHHLHAHSSYPMPM